MTASTITQIWRFPVKSIRGESLQNAEITELGIEHDRGWGVFDVDTGNVLTARRTPELLFASAAVVDGEVTITLPDETTVTGVGASTDERLSAWLGRAVELRPAGDEGGTYENPMDVENDDDWVSWQGPGGAWHDSTKSRVSIVSEDSLGSWDLARFRTNIVVTGSGEDELVGSSVRLGNAELDVTKRIDRCVMITRPQPGLDRDLELLKHINAERDRTLSIGALVSSGGSIAVGDVLSSA